MPHSFYFDVVEALAEVGCAFCRLGTRTASRYLDHLAYENVNDYDVRAVIRAGWGLCNRHAWQFVGETRDLLGAAIIYRDLLRTLQRQTAGADAARVRDLVPRAACVACDALATEIADCAQLLREHWEDDRLRGAFSASEGLCWRHLLTLLEGERSAERRCEMATLQRTAWERRRARAHQRGTADPLHEAIASARGMNGIQIAAEAAGPATPEGGAVIENLPSGHCPPCAAVGGWQGLIHPADFPCAVHAWQSACPRSPFAACEATLAQLEARLDHLTRVKPPALVLPGWTRRYLPPAALPPEITADLSCATCCAQLDFEVAAVAAAPTATLCLPHLRLAAHHAPAFPSHLRQTRETWHKVELQLAEYIRKQDYRFQHEPLGEEQEAPRWAVALVAGAEGIR